MNGNPFYVQPMQSYGSQLAGLSQTIGDIGKQKRAEQRFAETKAAMEQAWGSGDPDQIAKLAIDYPESAKAIEMMMGIDNQRKKDEAIEFSRSALANWDNPAVVGELLDKRGDMLEAQGRDATNTEFLRFNYFGGQQQREAAKRELMAIYANLDPKGHEALKGDSGKKFKQATGKGMEGWVFDEATGQFSLDPNYQAYLESDASRLASKEMLDAKDIVGVNDKVTSLVKDSTGIHSAALDLESLLEGGTTTDQIAAVFKFMKAMDPSSTVRESELGLVYSAEGAAQGFANYVNSLIQGKKIDQEGFRKIVETSKRLANTAIDSTTDAVSKYTDVIADNMTPKQLEKIRARVPSKFELQPVEQVPPELPAGTTNNGDGTYTLPNGQVIRKTGG